jgi:hypothetical protein
MVEIHLLHPQGQRSKDHLALRRQLLGFRRQFKTRLKEPEVVGFDLSSAFYFSNLKPLWAIEVNWGA